MGTSAEQMTEYSAFSAGFISSLRNWASCLFACSNIEMVSIGCAMILLLTVWNKGIITNQHVCCLQICKGSFADNFS